MFRRVVVKKVVDVVEFCPRFKRTVLLADCLDCPYFAGFDGFREIKCKFGEVGGLECKKSKS